MRLWLMGLDENAPRLFTAPGAPGDLRDLLKAAFARPQVAALQRKIRVDDADEG